MYANHSFSTSLSRLRALLQTGAITREEFELLKQKLTESVQAEDFSASGPQNMSPPAVEAEAFPDPLPGGAADEQGLSVAGSEKHRSEHRKNSRSLDSVLVLSLVMLLAFGGYLYVAQPSSERLTSRHSRNSAQLVAFPEVAADEAEDFDGGAGQANRKETVLLVAEAAPEKQEVAEAAPALSAPPEKEPKAGPAADQVGVATSPDTPQQPLPPTDTAAAVVGNVKAGGMAPDAVAAAETSLSGQQVVFREEEKAPAASEPAAAPLSGADREALKRISNRLRAFYVDLGQEPLAAKDHFAPQVERYNSLTRTTPGAIQAALAKDYYPEFLNSRSSFDPTSLQLLRRSGEGYEVRYVEHAMAFRKSRNQQQETSTRVRVRLDKNFHITYFEQEEVLEKEEVKKDASEL